MTRWDLNDDEDRASFFDQCLALVLLVALFTATVAALAVT